MIEEIAIRDLGVIHEARLPLGPGFTALTGETGAGKTMVVTALGLLLGARADAGSVRAGEAQAFVEGDWRVPTAGPVAERVRDAGGDVDDDGDGTGLLVATRTVSSEGRGRATVGGRTAPVGVLAELGEQLVVVHGQSDQQRLRSQAAQRDALDRFGGAELAAALVTYRAAYASWQGLAAELATLTAERADRAAEADELRAALDELERLAPQPGEDEELAARAQRLGNLEELRLAAGTAQEALSSQSLDDTPDVTALLDAARRSVERASSLDAELAPVAEALTSASFAIADISGQLASYLGGLDTDGGRELEQVQQRRADLAEAVRRHGTLEAAIAFLDTGSTRLLELDTDATRVESLGEAVAAARAELEASGARLTDLRTAAAATLGERVSAELGALAMPDARLVVEVTARDEFGASGGDLVAFLLRPHPGSEPRPVGRGASGGELSRLMLAIEVVVAAADPVPTFVFDEVDAGVGGASATEIGRRLARLAEQSQVIVVTHLAQVAAFATNHLRVAKGADDSTTVSRVERLDGDVRIAEMARLLSGTPDSEVALAHARELLETAGTI